MLRKTDLRALAESVGLAPSLADAEAAADKYRKDMVATQTAREDAEEALRAAGANADDATITRLYSALAAAKTAERRAERVYHASERDLAEAQTAYAAKTKQAARSALDKAAATYTKAALEIDRLSALIAAEVEIINRQYEGFAIARTAGVAGLYMPVTGATLATLAIERAIAAQAGEWTENRPSASEAGARVTGAVGAAA